MNTSINSTSRVWTRDEIKNLILNNDKMVARSLVQLYNCQEANEKECKETTVRNGCGFNAIDANILSSFAEFYLQNSFLSVKQIAIARKKLVKYVGQLTNIANAKA